MFYVLPKLIFTVHIVFSLRMIQYCPYPCIQTQSRQFTFHNMSKYPCQTLTGLGPKLRRPWPACCWHFPLTRSWWEWSVYLCVWSRKDRYVCVSRIYVFVYGYWSHSTGISYSSCILTPLNLHVKLTRVRRFTPGFMSSVSVFILLQLTTTTTTIIPCRWASALWCQRSVIAYTARPEIAPGITGGQTTPSPSLLMGSLRPAFGIWLWVGRCLLGFTRVALWFVFVWVSNFLSTLV